ncbi:MAG: hypothetical protein M0P12_01060 [Paludibacteraceae bacterium]|nr:hypothetical protein [Paludibacteraceae bacterium]
MVSSFDHIFICDSNEICEQCQHFKCRNTKESIEDDLETILGNPSLCGKEYPKIAMLKWVIDGGLEKVSFLRKFLNLFRG